ncbi:NAD(P)-dependent oxidoreductase [Stenotrophomonas maltophilia]|uniref:NAD-dependent epimerase/dehydratase family protein n=1 Tax=Stenotrophomonas maltophilia TaxID=40324 RepID=UPI000DA2C87C|nr:NAD(P)-dependent oxidoreductase [Stenotrophomonas maltophilia]MBA0228522.1 NAD(P)-dependent oxidoreductase [Stenotrophomonas maltophilia]MBA0293652.1 NAD(P)-dependent oxidoreductase [Stenotrophomonas maltophilia]MBA0348990.1 NAD(P)-dependent oxidoreductase [Stenotrophomonas maltophilia]MBA0416446.1 NAD(P)-dependent oxidoreductase [Stenotrophomonas maltophilia]MBH1372331.1 NAD(P)-dependent oxidoreductase [Stenotrophomonas maltophilia]
MARHIVIGGSGFTGTYLVRSLLSQNQQVTIIDIAVLPTEFSGRVDYHCIDIVVPGALQQVALAEGDIVYHLAARQFHNDVPHHNQDAWFAEVNVGGTANVLEWMSQLATPRLVYTSTDMVYGLPQKLPVPPDHAKNPLGPYGRSKAASEQLCEQARGRGFRITILRPRMIVGPGRFGILTKLFKLMDLNLPIPTIGSGRNRYQMIAVEDVVNAIQLSVAHDLPAVALSLGSGPAPVVRELLRNTIRRIGSHSMVIPVPAGPLKLTLSLLEKLGKPLLHREQYQIADINYVVDIAPTESTLQWAPTKNDEDMLVAAYEHYSKSR